MPQLPITVLLIDSQSVVRRVLADTLHDFFWIRVVGETGTAQEGLEMALSLQPDVAVVEYTLPDGDGAQLTRLFREKTSIEVIGYSYSLENYFSEVDIKQAMLDAGACFFLEKGCPIETIVSGIAQCVDREDLLR